MLLKTLGKKKTESEYEKYIARVACSFFSLGILGLFIVRSNSLSDYALGLVMGVTIGSFPLLFVSDTLPVFLSFPVPSVSPAFFPISSAVVPASFPVHFCYSVPSKLPAVSEPQKFLLPYTVLSCLIAILFPALYHKSFDSVLF